MIFKVPSKPLTFSGSVKENTIFVMAKQVSGKRQGSAQQELGCDARSHLPTLQQADVGLRENVSPLGNWVVQVEIRASEHSGNNRLQEVPCFGRASGIICQTQRGTYLIPGNQTTKARLWDNWWKCKKANYEELWCGEGVSLTEKRKWIFKSVWETLLGKVQAGCF